MPRYVDGFLLPLPKKNIAAYRKLAREANKVWKKHGALEYCECVAEDLSMKGPASFVKRTKAKAGETVVFAWIVYRSRKDRDRINAAVMQDPVMQRMCEKMKQGKRMPFEFLRMSYGGFDVLVEA